MGALWGRGENEIKTKLKRRVKEREKRGEKKICSL